MKFESNRKKPETFAEALLGETSWMPESEAVPAVTKEELTEKAVVLESFTRFAEEKLSESPDQEIKFEGGSLALKTQGSYDPFVAKFSSLADWLTSLELRLNPSVIESLFTAKSQIRVLFYVDEIKLDIEVPATEPSREFLYCFEKDVAELFEKMVKAMKLKPLEFALSAVSFSGEPREQEDLLEEIHWRQPEFVVPLGAQATQALLGSKERLATIHGKYFLLPRLNSKTVHVVPLFHPNVISTNQNMKKSTWTDMQKMMKSMGLL